MTKKQIKAFGYAIDQNGFVYNIVDDDEFFKYRKNVFVRPITYEEYERQRQKEAEKSASNGVFKMTFKTRKHIFQDCNECVNFWREYDTNACGCKKEDLIDDEMWEDKKRCPYFESYEGDDE